MGHKVAGALLFVGGINWGLVAINPSWNLISMIFNDPMMMSIGSRIVYGLVGLSALMMLACKKCCGNGMCGGKCEGGKCMGGSCKGMGAKCSGMKEGMKCSGQGMKCSGNGPMQK
ncbi:MAG: DUF378 domain-containing protein [Patescibacteria group bacterium]